LELGAGRPVLALRRHHLDRHLHHRLLAGSRLMTDETTHHAPHPTTGQYVKIAIVLAVVTAVEVALFYIDEAVDMAGWDGPLLIVLSFFKFVVVIGWFMHLRFEKPMLTRF